MFKSKIALAALFFSSVFQLNSINFRQILALGTTTTAFAGYYAYENSDTLNQKKLEFLIHRIKNRIRTINSDNIDQQEILKIKHDLAKILERKYLENIKITEKEKTLLTDLEESEEIDLFAMHFCKAANYNSNEKIPASPYFQNIFAETKKTLNLNYDKPIYKNTSNYPARYIAYIDDLGDIYISENTMNLRPYGVVRICILHELVHKKRNHQTIETILLKNFFPSKMVNELSDEELQSINPLLNISTLIKNHETEADSTALEIGNCYKCSEDISLFRSDNEFVSELGYFTKSQILEIAKKQKEQNSLCEYHKKPDRNIVHKLRTKLTYLLSNN